MTTAAYPNPRHSPAPWAELVPGYGPVTVDLLLELPDDGYIYEVVEGVLVRMAGSGKQAAKARLYLGAGTRLVWVVWPQSEHIDVWRRDVLSGPVSVLAVGGTLAGEDVIPGFACAVDALFTDPLRPA
jgi:hypothetical protein